MGVLRRLLGHSFVSDAPVEQYPHVIHVGGRSTFWSELAELRELRNEWGDLKMMLYFSNPHNRGAVAINIRPRNKDYAALDALFAHVKACNAHLQKLEIFGKTAESKAHFLESDIVRSGNQGLIADAQEAFGKYRCLGDYAAALKGLLSAFASRDFTRLENTGYCDAKDIAYGRETREQLAKMDSIIEEMDEAVLLVTRIEVRLKEAKAA